MSDKPSGTPVEKIGHDACGSRDALQVFQDEDGNYNGYCFACSSYIFDPYSEGKPVQQTTKRYYNPMQDVNSIYQYPVADLVHRGIRSDIVNYFNVRVGYSTVNPSLMTHIYYPQMNDGKTISAFKEREINTKAFKVIGSCKNAEFFGQMQARASGSKWLYITEGEDDAMVLFQAMLDRNAGTKAAQYMPAVVSVPAGASSIAKVATEQASFLNTFDEITLVFDNDEPGRKAVEEATKVMPLNKLKVATLPLKDPCDMVAANRTEEMLKVVLWKGEAPKLTSVVSIKEVKELAKKPMEMGFKWPWETLTKITYGIRPGIYGIAAGTGTGKSTTFHQLQLTLSVDQTVPIGIFALEESNTETVVNLASKYAGITGHRFAASSQQALHQAIDNLPETIHIYKHDGDKDWENVKLAIKQLALVHNVKVMFIDPLTALTATMTASAANELLNAMFAELASMVESLKITVFYSSHLNIPTSGESHESGGKVLLSQFTGSRAMIRWSHLVLGLEGNSQTEDEAEKNSRILKILKDRELGNTGKYLKLTYDRDSGLLKESKDLQVETGVTY